MSFRFIHCSDIHLLDLTGVRPWRFFNKRLTGGVNLALKRRRMHSDALFDQIIEHARARKADRLIVTGDLTNLALEAEFELVKRRLGEAGVAVTVIPGNHDAYTKGSVRSRRFETYLSGFMEGERASGADYPFVQRFPGVGLVGLSTAVATLPLFATGTLGDAQLGRLAKILDALKREGRARIVLIHHPVMPGVSKARHDLLDLAGFGAVIERHGAELILHGHEHKHIEGVLPGPEGPALVHGVGSGTCLSLKPGREGAFTYFEVAPGTIEKQHYVWRGASFERAE
ncbi:MAG: metallophosphoesterase [Myxococcales bacterium]|nr:metallophosphoesterase [Myxococcales bacterium]MCB9753448.1 metallophosphoesterase [Myxococcales bacterium]